MADPYAKLIAEARAQVAAGRDPAEWEARVRAVRGDAAAEQRALKQLAAIAAVHRARSLVGREAAPPPPPPPPARRRPVLRTRPTISANMDVRRDGANALVWEAARGVAGWEVRVSERPDPRSDYAVRETLTLPPETTRVELPLGDLPLRVHVLGRARDGRLLRRAVVSGLTRDGWTDRWQRRASAS